jgi:hypothetical protein
MKALCLALQRRYGDDCKDGKETQQSESDQRPGLRRWTFNGNARNEITAFC